VTTEARPFDHQLFAKVAPFAAVALLAFALSPLPPTADSGEVTAALVLTAVIFAVVSRSPWRRLPAWAQALPPIAYFVVIALLRDAEGGAASEVSPLVLLPVFWLALYGTRAQLGVAIASVAVFFVVPPALDPGQYPTPEWERAILWTVTSSVVGYTVQALVAQIRTQAVALREVARTDDLTGLPNRRAWEDELQRHLQVLDFQEQQPVAVVALDFDDLPGFAGRHGSQGLERLARMTATSWSRHLTPNDLLAHCGSAGFRLLLLGDRALVATEVVEGLREATPGAQTVSAGIAKLGTAETAQSLVARADGALQKAKARDNGGTAVAKEQTADELLLSRLLEQNDAAH
jgi:diguanylate cyclase (GGDEF)-like protein